MSKTKKLLYLAAAGIGLAGCAYAPPGYYYENGTYVYHPGALSPLPSCDPFVPCYAGAPPPPPGAIPPPGAMGAPPPGTPVPPPPRY